MSERYETSVYARERSCRTFSTSPLEHAWLNVAEAASAEREPDVNEVVWGRGVGVGFGDGSVGGCAMGWPRWAWCGLWLPVGVLVLGRLLPVLGVWWVAGAVVGCEGRRGCGCRVLVSALVWVLVLVLVAGAAAGWRRRRWWCWW